MGGVTNVTSSQYTLLRLLKAKYENSTNSSGSIFDTIDYGSDFDWSTYADLVNSTGNAEAISATDDSATANKKGFMQAIKELFSQDAVKKEADKNNDGKLSAEEMKDYIANNNVAGLDGDASNISLSDLEKLITDKSIDLSGTIDALESADEAGTDAAGTGSSTGSTGDQPTKLQKLEAKVTTCQTNLDQSTAALTSLSGMVADSSDMKIDNKKVQAAYDKKMDAQGKYQTALADAQSNDLRYDGKYDETTRLMSSIQTDTEAVNTKTEQQTNANANLTLSNQNLQSIGAQISSVNSQISTLGSPKPVPEATEDNASEVAAAKAYNNQLQEKLNSLNDQLAGLQVDLAQEQDNNAKLTTEIETLTNDISDLQGKIDTNNTNLENLKKDMGEALRTAVENVQNAKSEYDDASSKYIEVKNSEMEKANREVKKDSEALDKAVKARDDEQTRVDKESMDATYDSILNTPLTKEQSANLDELNTYLSDLYDKSPEKIEEIQSVLGFSIDYLPGIVMEHPEVIEELKNLVANESAQATFKSSLATSISNTTYPSETTSENMLAYYTNLKAQIKGDDYEFSNLYNIALLYSVDASVVQTMTGSDKITDAIADAGMGYALSDITLMSQLTSATTVEDFKDLDNTYSNTSYPNAQNNLYVGKNIYMYSCEDVAPESVTSILTEYRDSLEGSGAYSNDTLSMLRNEIKQADNDVDRAAAQKEYDERNSERTARLGRIQYVVAAIEQLEVGDDGYLDTDPITPGAEEE